MKKKTGKRILSFLMAVIMVIGTLQVPGLTLEVHATTVVASGSCGTNVIWELDDAGKLTISGKGEITSTPWLDQGYTDNIETLVIENEVTNIPNQAFQNCKNLTGVTIPGSVKTIGNGAFYNCGMSTVVLPEGVESIGPGAFYGCKKLKSISIPKTVTEFIPNAFDSCSALKEINVDGNNKMFRSVDGVVYNTGITSLIRYPDGKDIAGYEFPNTVTDIGEMAFFGCKNLAEITIPANVTSLGYEAFSDCTSLASVTLPAGLSDIGFRVFLGCTALTNITIPGGLGTTGGGTFEDCSALTSVVIEEGVMEIDFEAFNGCSSLTEITIPKSLYRIRTYAFKDCNKTIAVKYNGTAAEWNDISLSEESGLDNYTLSCLGVDRVASGTCGDGMSWNLDSTGQLTISGSGEVNSNPWKPVLPEETNYVGYVKKVVIGSGVTDITKAELKDFYNLKEISVEDGNTAYITEDGVLFNKDKTQLIQYPCCKQESSYSVPDTVKGIGDYAFTRCIELTAITIPEGVVSINEAAFFKCKNLSDISIPESVTIIGGGAFAACVSLNNISIPGNVTEIKDNTFGNCAALNTVDIPDKVTAIGENAFANCKKLSDVYYDGAREDWNSIAIDPTNTYLTVKAKIHYMKGRCGADATWTLTKDGLLTISGSGELVYDSNKLWRSDDVTQLVIGDGVTAIRDNVFGACNMESVTIPESVTAIGEFAFSGCDLLTEVVFAGNTVTIGSFAFSDCYSLESITFPENVVIAEEAFYGCNKLKDVYYGGTEENWYDNSKVVIGDDIILELLLEDKVHFTVFVTGVSLAPATKELRVGESVTLTATVAPEDATNKKVSWTSSAPTVATVADGVVTAVGEGESTITVTTEDGGKTAACKVTVAGIAVTGVSIAPETLSLKVGESVTLTATVAPANATNKKVKWGSSAEAVATVADGVVTAVAEGETTITAMTEDGDKTASCKVTVTKVEEPAEPDKPEEPVMVEGPLGPEKPDLSRYTASGNEIAAKSINLKKTVFKDVKGI
nr:leucine-rich repeat protein [Lachnospiraceae bacterium]